MRSESVRARFGRLVSEAAQKAGYDLAQRGTKAELSRKMGISESAVGRMFSGQALPDPWSYQTIAKVLDMDIQVLMVESGLLSRESLSTPSQTRASRVGSDSITSEEAANALGIYDPVARNMLAATIERLRRIQDAERESDGGGGAAAQA